MNITAQQEVEILKRNVEELQGQLQQQYKKVSELLEDINELETAMEQYCQMAESIRRVGKNDRRK